MLLGALRALAGHSGPLVVPAFYLKVLALEGFGSMVDACIECGTREDLVAFDVDAGGVRCAAHRAGTPLSAEALALLDDILGGRLGSALNAPPSATTVEIDHLATRAMEHHLERRLRSVAILDHG
jgi:DNA repair protein RecO (recombination protein O)